MSAIFISHSSKDNSAAEKMRANLTRRGYRSIFLDSHPDDGIAGGAKWEAQLYSQLKSCHALIILCSKHSMDSKWCWAEVVYARACHKYVIPVKISRCKIESLIDDTQLIDLTSNPVQGYRRLGRALVTAGLDAEGSFVWNSRRPPFPGLESFSEKDAAVFFGRQDEVSEITALLNHVRVLPEPRLFVVRGPSGSGKSSLILAGVLPRLKRDKDHWVALEPFRPTDNGGPFVGLRRAIAAALKIAGRRRD